MPARALAATVAGLGLLLIGGGGAFVLGIAWVVDVMELGVLFWALPVLAVVGAALAAYGVVELAGDILGDTDGVRGAVDELSWRQLKHYID